VSRIWLVPSMLRVLLASHPGLEPRVPQLTFWVASGEELPTETFDAFTERHPCAVLYNLYGTSEVWDATWYDPRHDGPAHPSVPIGRPIANMQAFILDPHLQLVPVGVPGELHVGGAGLARGYLDHPDLTAQKFIPHPFSSEPGARLYKTGDLARYRADGVIEFLGRMDRQVKLRGFRIELDEVEAALAQHKAVREAAVLLREDNPGEPRLVAYIVPHQHGQSAEEVSALALRQFLRRTLPEYMLPSAFVYLAAFPLTTNGKLDRRALPAPDVGRSVLANAYVAPRTPGEVQLARIFGQLLGLERVGAHDNFFELGGHSLLAIRAVSRIREAFDVAITLRAIFETSTVAGLEQLVHEAQLRGDTDQTPVIVPLSRAAHATTLLPGGELELEALSREHEAEDVRE
jgi:acyl carrier protein